MTNPAADLLATLDLNEAAKVLHAHPETVRAKAKAGELPGRKVGKRWIFSLVALQRYLAGEWTPRVVQGDTPKEETCRSLNEVVVPIGITSFTRREAESRYKQALAPSTAKKRRNTTTV
jgi:excisionase family DNA binding protein